MRFVLDFIVIGAQKSGTTTLHKLLEKHPGIYVPPSKEVPFFSEDELYGMGWPAFSNTLYSGVDSSKCMGKVTPQYMCDPCVPQRIHGSLPHVQLIAILRNPIERALSHYHMMVKRGDETRSFDMAVDDLLRSGSLDEARMLRAGRSSETRCYIVWGEYGRILSRFCQYFSTEQLAVMYMDDLANNPLGFYEQLVGVLGLGLGPVPSNLGKRYHVGGRKRRVPHLKDWVRRSGLIYLWRMLPDSYRRYGRYWVDQLNTLPATDQEKTIAPGVRDRLIRHYREDLKRLTFVTGNKLPWREFDL